MASDAVKASRLRLAIVSILLAILLITLHLMSHAVQNSATLSKLYVPLLVLSIAGLTVLLGMVGLNLVRLIQAYRRSRPGARLSVRMVSLFVTLSLIPVLVVYYYSMQFLQQGIDSWFDVEIDTAMTDALSLGKASLNLERSRLLQQADAISRELGETSSGDLLTKLATLHALSGATELTVMDANGLVIASRNRDPGVLVADTPDSAVLQQARETGAFVGITPYGLDGLLHLRVVVSDLALGRIVQALYPTTERVTLLGDKVEESYESYQQLIYLRDKLRLGFTITLLMVLLFTVFGAIWAAIFSARKVLAPIVELAEATSQVADGDYSTRLPETSHRDELGFLVTSFNQMTQRIAQARDQAAQSQREVEAQHAYLQTLLEHLTTGVLTFDADMKLQTANSAASRILDVDLEACRNMTISDMIHDDERLASFLDNVSQVPFEREQQVSLDTATGRRTLRWQVTPMAGQDGSSGAIVLMFDDVTDLLQAQRDAAWGEVARRLAHEIKNPLTPIQLSAERLRRKYLPVLDADQAGVLDRATHTIVQQVDAMKQMVNAFSDYAKPSVINAEAAPLEFDKLLQEVMGLYGATPGIRIITGYHAGQARMQGDPVKLRQLFHNLVKNSLEALNERSDGECRIISRMAMESGCEFIELNVQDNGPGFDDTLVERVFDPYVTTKTGGTGLGLSIVKKIVEEHRGGIWLSNRPEGGANIVVRFPSWKETDGCDVIPQPGVENNKHEEMHRAVQTEKT